MQGNRTILTAIAVIAACGLGAGTAQAAGDLRLDVVGNRADLVSGGDALVQVTNATGKVTADLDGRNVSGAFAKRPNGAVQGVLTGLKVGRNVLTAHTPDGRGARLTITNHPIGGPVFSGEQIQPWLCTTEDEGLGKA